MKVYTYDRETGFFLGESQADPSPMEPGKFLIPAFSTERKPPAETEEGIPAFDRVKGKWKLVPRPVAAVEEVAVAEATPDAIDAMRAGIRTMLNAVAVAQDFDSIDEAVSYAEEPAVPLYQALGQALRSYRSIVWHAFDTLLAEIKADMTPMPADADALFAHIPKFVAPYVGELLSVRPAPQPIPEEVMKAQADARAEADRLAIEQSAPPAVATEDSAPAEASQDQPE
jgi:hypothetical protein